MNEKRLVQKLRKRDARAFEALVNQYQAPILNMIYRMIGSREEAEDLAQEVFVTVFKKIDSFRGESSLATWMYRIASNHCKNRQKYLRRRYHDRTAYDDITAGDENLSVNHFYLVRAVVGGSKSEDSNRVGEFDRLLQTVP